AACFAETAHALQTSTISSLLYNGKVRKGASFLLHELLVETYSALPMQPVVSNTSPLIALSILDWLHLPRHFFYPIIIPQAMVSEAIPQGIARPGAREIDLAIKAGWIQVASPV